MFQKYHIFIDVYCCFINEIYVLQRKLYWEINRKTLKKSNLSDLNYLKIIYILAI